MISYLMPIPAKLSRIRYQQGAVIFILTYLFFLAVLALSLSTYSGVVNQYQSIKNEVASRKKFWLAEAGLACAFVALNDTVETTSSELPNAVAIQCGVDNELQVSWNKSSSNQFKVRSSIEEMVVSKEIVANLDDKSVSWIDGSWDDFE